MHKTFSMPNLFVTNHAQGLRFLKAIIWSIRFTSKTGDDGSGSSKRQRMPFLESSREYRWDAIPVTSCILFTLPFRQRAELRDIVHSFRVSPPEDGLPRETRDATKSTLALSQYSRSNANRNRLFPHFTMGVGMPASKGKIAFNSRSVQDSILSAKTLLLKLAQVSTVPLYRMHFYFEKTTISQTATVLCMILSLIRLYSLVSGC